MASVPALITGRCDTEGASQSLRQRPLRRRIEPQLVAVERRGAPRKGFSNSITTRWRRFRCGTPLGSASRVAHTASCSSLSSYSWARRSRLAGIGRFAVGSMASTAPLSPSARHPRQSTSSPSSRSLTPSTSNRNETMGSLAKLRGAAAIRLLHALPCDSAVERVPKQACEPEEGRAANCKTS